MKSVVTTSRSITGYAGWVLKDTTKYQTTNKYDRDGNITESLSEGRSTTKYVYTRVDGNKAFRTVEVKPFQCTIRGTIDSDEMPIDTNEKRTKPDPRFDYRYVYDVEDIGRKVTERKFAIEGKLFRRRSFD